MNRIHPTAIISPNAVLGDGVEVGPYAYIDEHVVIGDGCKVHPHAIIYSYVKLGQGCEVFRWSAPSPRTSSMTARSPTWR